jgi:SAM-dependent methyltransferase
MKDQCANPFDDVSVAAGYEGWYCAAGRRADRLEKALLKRLMGGFPQAETILEVGCGTGHFTRWLNELGFHAVGLDLSPTMLAYASPPGNVDLTRGDALQLPFTTGAFDLLAMITALEFLENPLQALTEARRVSRLGLLLGVINRSSWVGRKYRRQGGPIWGKARFLAPHELIELVRQACGESHDILWRTTLWPFCPGSSYLPWGGFIGMMVRWKSKTTPVPSISKDG